MSAGHLSELEWRRLSKARKLEDAARVKALAALGSGRPRKIAWDGYRTFVQNLLVAGMDKKLKAALLKQTGLRLKPQVRG